MTQKPYLISGLVGNSRVLGCLDGKGQLVRLYWPRIDDRQNVEQVTAGVFLPQKGWMTWLDQPEWQHSQHYVQDTNILVTSSVWSAGGISIRVEDFMVPEKAILVRNYSVQNLTPGAQEVQFFYYSDLLLGCRDHKKTSEFAADSECLFQYHQDCWLATGAQRPVHGYQCGHAWEAAAKAMVNGNDQSMGSDAALMWGLGSIPPGEGAQLTIYTCCAASRQEAAELLAWARGITGSQLMQQTELFWLQYLKAARQLGPVNEAVNTLYKRSLLVFRLVSDGSFGSILAAPEIDEDFTRCGGYGYCWPRDAAYITRAYDLAGLGEMARHFYRWLLQTQAPDGSCQQRYYIDGTVAPNWGIQLDEVGSVLWGMWEHYRNQPELEFLQDSWPFVSRAVEHLLEQVSQKSDLHRPCYDLWEERKGVHTYTATALWGGLTGAAAMAQVLGKAEEYQSWLTAADRLRAAILLQAWDEKSGSFVRSVKVSVSREEYDWLYSQGLAGEISYNSKGYPHYYKGKDLLLDCSLLGLSIPFGLLEAEDSRMQQLSAQIQARLNSPKVGGLLRYQGDSYMGGNPWVITTLWLALFQVKAGDYGKARELLHWVVSHTTTVGLLPEQVDRDTGETAWVVPLTWSHAMFVLTVLALAEAGQLPG